MRYQTEYFVKWEEYSSDENSWKPEGNLPSSSIQEFEESRARGARRPENNVVNQTDMDRFVDLEPEKILGSYSFYLIYTLINTV